MDSNTFCVLFGNAIISHDKLTYVSQWAANNMCQPSKNASKQNHDTFVQNLNNIWDVAHITFKELLSRADLTMTECSTRFCIPFRTIQDWCAGRRTPPRYIILTIAEIVGVLNVEIELAYRKEKTKMNVTIYRVLSDLPNAEEFLFADEQKADSVAATQNTTVVSRDFSLPKGWHLTDINDEVIIFDVEKNPYNVRLYGEVPAEDHLFGAIAIPFFNSGISTVLEPVE